MNVNEINIYNMIGIRDVFRYEKMMFVSNKSLKLYTHTHTHTHTQLFSAEPKFSGGILTHLRGKTF